MGATSAMHVKSFWGAAHDASTGFGEILDEGIEEVWEFIGGLAVEGDVIGVDAVLRRAYGKPCLPSTVRGPGRHLGQRVRGSSISGGVALMRRPNSGSSSSIRCFISQATRR
jgi:hypothetical protein